MSKTLPKWDAEREATLASIVGTATPVSAELVAQAAETLETTPRSVAAKLRNQNIEVSSTAKAAGKTYTEAEEAELTSFLNANPEAFTYAEIAAQVLGGSRSPKQIQGKILSMDLFGLVKATPKVERVKSYTDAEEATIKTMVLAGAFIEDIADAVKREVNSVRGKILSMSRVDESITIPKQRVYKEKAVDAFAALGDVSEMTVEAIATAIDKSARGVRTLLTHRGIDCADHKGAAKKAKNVAAKEAAAA